eukprot:TRINITY_DN476_c0_g1_i3.p1 TRINITY_DN476_c0_g1~~TRINITY_DN476_c0_g1_i3.p1  ORF type:complete len:316 (+),score=36.85 TRINITY_DN476_c0_g1_i3:299-1246(+)
MSLAFGSSVTLFSRGLFKAIKEAESWDNGLNLEDCKSAVEDMRFWLQDIKKMPKQKLPSCPIMPPSITLQTDASEVGYGGFAYLTERKIKRYSAGKLPQSIISQSSSARELYGIWSCLKSLCSDIPKGSIIRVRSDSQVAVQVLKIGSKVEDCQIWARKVALFALKNGWQLRPVWVPRGQNTLADWLSRQETEPELNLSWSAYKYACNIFKISPVIDRFASEDSKKCKRFNSKWYCNSAEAVDALSVSWDIGKWNYVFPPVKLIGRVLQKITYDQCRALLVLPRHENSTWWGELIAGDLSNHSSGIFTDCLVWLD